jgi:FKBP-type peptidyl-prolyl cis-trans isomerase SlyD
MQITKDKVVTLHYDLFNAETNELLESSREEDQPLIYLHGHGGIIAGLEQALAGKQAGDSTSTTLTAKDAYGERQENAVQRLSMKYFKRYGKLKVGMQVPLEVENGYRIVTIVKVGLKSVDIDPNHPLAGLPLRFELNVVDVRDASAEEISHGHVHGEGGHHH